jgi:putative flippase GtrA
MAMPPPDRSRSPALHEVRAPVPHAPLPAPSLPGYRPTGWPLVDRALAWLDRRTGGRADWFQRFATFLVVGGIGTVVNLTCFSAVYYGMRLPLGASARWLIAFAVGSEISILTNFFANDFFTFGALPGHARPRAVRCARFHVTAAGGVLVTMLISFVLMSALFPPVLAQALAILVATIFNFVIHHLYTYRPIKHPRA